MADVSEIRIFSRWKIRDLKKRSTECGEFLPTFSSKISPQICREADIEDSDNGDPCNLCSSIVMQIVLNYGTHNTIINVGAQYNCACCMHFDIIALHFSH